MLPFENLARYQPRFGHNNIAAKSLVSPSFRQRMETNPHLLYSLLFNDHPANCPSEQGPKQTPPIVIASFVSSSMKLCEPKLKHVQNRLPEDMPSARFVPCILHSTSKFLPLPGHLHYSPPPTPPVFASLIDVPVVFVHPNIPLPARTRKRLRRRQAARIAVGRGKRK